jgi:hypothetical protein
MIRFKQLRKELNESLGIAESVVYFDDEGNRHIIVVDEDMRCSIDGNTSAIQFESIEEALEHAKAQIAVEHIAEEVTVITETKIAELLKKHNLVERVTDTHIRSCVDCYNSKEFTLDPVITEMKRGEMGLSDKFEYVLNDGSIIAISEKTLSDLTVELKDKYKIVEHMRENKHNFMQIIKNED